MLSLEDQKLISHYLRNKIYRPFGSRLTQLYFGANNASDLLVASNLEEKDFVYCDPTQSTGLIKLVQPEHALLLQNWFAALPIDHRRPYVFYLGEWLTATKSVSWKDSTPIPNYFYDEMTQQTLVKVGEDEPKVIANPVSDYFIIIRLEELVAQYRPVFFEPTVEYYDYDVSALETSKVCTLQFKNNILNETDAYICDVKVVVVPGYDLINTKPLLTTKNWKYQVSVRIWASVQKPNLNYGCYYRDDEIVLSITRDNTYIFPMKIRTSS